MTTLPYSQAEFHNRDKIIAHAMRDLPSGKWKRRLVEEYARALCTIRDLRDGLVPLANIIEKKNKEIAHLKLVWAERERGLERLRCDNSNLRDSLYHSNAEFQKANLRLQRDDAIRNLKQVSPFLQEKSDILEVFGKHITRREKLKAIRAILTAPSS